MINKSYRMTLTPGNSIGTGILVENKICETCSGEGYIEVDNEISLKEYLEDLYYGENKSFKELLKVYREFKKKGYVRTICPECDGTGEWEEWI